MGVCLGGGGVPSHITSAGGEEGVLSNEGLWQTEKSFCVCRGGGGGIWFTLT